MGRTAVRPQPGEYAMVKIIVIVLIVVVVLALMGKLRGRR